jgi:hypothetical protein
MTDRKVKAQRLEAAGYSHVAGWLPASRAARIAAEIAAHAAEAERIAETPGTPGRPRKSNDEQIEKTVRRYEDALRRLADK